MFEKGEKSKEKVFFSEMCELTWKLFNGDIYHVCHVKSICDDVDRRFDYDCDVCVDRDLATLIDACRGQIDFSFLQYFGCARRDFSDVELPSQQSVGSENLVKSSVSIFN